MLDKIKNNYYVLMGISIFCLIVIVFTSSYAYFKAQVRGEGKGMNVIAGTIDLDITENSISTNNLLPISDSSKDTKAQIKDFTVKRTSNSDLDVCYNLYLVIDSISSNIKNSKYLKYELTDGSNVVSGNLSKLGYNSDGKGYILLAKNKYLSKSDTTGNTYKLKIWLSYDKSANQNDLLNSNITTHIYASGNNGNTCPGSVDTVIIPTLYEQILADNSAIKTRTDFNTTFTETNTGTLYKATEQIGTNPVKNVYYFAGDAKNNWVKFGKYQNDFSRYRGYYSTTDTSYKDYSTMDECTSASIYNKNCTEYKYANTGDDIYWRIIRTNHDGSVRLLYAGTSPDTTSGYIGKSAFNTIYNDPIYVGYKYGTTGSLENNRLNTNDSTMKTYIDNWYKNNLTAYTKYLSNDAVYCNDRNLKSGETYSNSFDYASWERIYTNKQPTYNCTNMSDAFSVNNTSAKLDYPVGLMTIDELSYAGGAYKAKLTTPYAWYYTNANGKSITGSEDSWSLSPSFWNSASSGDWRWGGSSEPGYLSYNSADLAYAVRPSVSLKSCTKWASGDGSSSNPYTIQETTSGC
jgi:hypothetical protein